MTVDSNNSKDILNSLFKKIDEISKKDYDGDAAVKEFGELVIETKSFVRNSGIKRIKDQDWYFEYCEFDGWTSKGVPVGGLSAFYQNPTIGQAYEEDINNLKTILKGCRKELQMLENLKNKKQKQSAIKKEKELVKMREFKPIKGNWEFNKWEKGENMIRCLTPTIKNLDGRDPRNVAFGLFEGEVKRGIIKTKVKFDDTGSCIARIIIGYNSETKGYYSVGIGGYNVAYLVDRYDENIGWRAISYIGKKSIVKRNKEYQLEVELDGKRLALKIDNEEMIRILLHTEDLGTKAGLFSWGKGNVIFSDIKFENLENIINKPQENIIPKYDIVVSYAGEDRETVEEYVKKLNKKNVKVFYDKNERVDLWGKDLYEKLDDVYRTQGKYCVIFISKHYKEKLWTNHERKSAQVRAFKENREYILPVKLDDTEIPGIRETVGYIDLRDTSLEELVKCTIKKLKEMKE